MRVCSHRMKRKEKERSSLPVCQSVFFPSAAAAVAKRNSVDQSENATLELLINCLAERERGKTAISAALAAESSF